MESREYKKLSRTASGGGDREALGTLREEKQIRNTGRNVRDDRGFHIFIEPLTPYIDEHVMVAVNCKIIHLSTLDNKHKL